MVRMAMEPTLSDGFVSDSITVLPINEGLGNGVAIGDPIGVPRREGKS